jgi:predicted Zn-dependent protease
VAVLIQHALSYVQLHRFPEALRKLDQVLDITPDDADAIAYKGSIALGQGDLPRAEALLAPLRLAAGDNLVSRIKTYGAILQRQPAEIIVELKEIVTERDSALAYGGGELGFWLGWAQQVAGDPAAAQESWGRARTELESFLKDQPDNYRLLEILALTHMALGNKGNALSMAEQAMAVTPIEKDALAGPHPIEVLARVCAGTGSPDRAIAALQQLRSLKASSDALSVPLTPATLRLDPMFDPLWNDPRFQKLVEDGAPK